ncbi:MAG: hypothetical protein [Arizlama microvirus]|nr:MAG: hypothetical protein [Arizlama microvirus]
MDYLCGVFRRRGAKRTDDSNTLQSFLTLWLICLSTNPNVPRGTYFFTFHLY